MNLPPGSHGESPPPLPAYGVPPAVSYVAPGQPQGYILTPRGSTVMPASGIARPISTISPSGPSWAFTLVLACLAIGLLGAMIRYEQLRVKDEQVRASDLGREAAFSEAKAEDVGKLMADPTTQIIVLRGQSLSPVRTATLAWNARARSGVLFCDTLPPLDQGRAYQISAVAPDGSNLLTTLNARPGTSIYWFHLDRQPLPGAQLELSAGPNARATDPMLRGTLAATITSS